MSRLRLSRSRHVCLRFTFVVQILGQDLDQRFPEPLELLRLEGVARFFQRANDIEEGGLQKFAMAALPCGACAHPGALVALQCGTDQLSMLLQFGFNVRQALLDCVDRRISSHASYAPMCPCRVRRR